MGFDPGALNSCNNVVTNTEYSCNNVVRMTEYPVIIIVVSTYIIKY